jgi:hypothetical protein
MMNTKFKQSVGVKGIWKAVVKKATGETVSVKEVANLVPTVARTAMAVQHAGNATANMKVTHVAVGSDATPPSNADTTLGAEVARKAVSSKTNVANESSITAFFAAGEATGTHQEIGAFGNGNTTTASITSDSGILYSHVSSVLAIASDETLTLTLRTSFL